MSDNEIKTNVTQNWIYSPSSITTRANIDLKDTLVARRIQQLNNTLDSYNGIVWNNGTKTVMPRIKDIIFNPPATIVIWDDGTKTVVKTNNEIFSKEHGLAMAIAKRYFGNRSKFLKACSSGKNHGELYVTTQPYYDDWD